MNKEFENSVHEVAGDEILVWLESPSVVRIKSLNLYDDPIDMGEGEAEDLAATIAKLLDVGIDISDAKDVKEGVVYRFSNDLVVAWMEIGGVICVKIKKTHGDSVEMNKEEAMKFVNLIMAFVALV